MDYLKIGVKELWKYVDRELCVTFSAEGRGVNFMTSFMNHLHREAVVKSNTYGYDSSKPISCGHRTVCCSILHCCWSPTQPPASEGSLLSGNDEIVWIDQNL